MYADSGNAVKIGDSRATVTSYKPVLKAGSSLHSNQIEQGEVVS